MHARADPRPHAPRSSHPPSVALSPPVRCLFPTRPLTPPPLSSGLCMGAGVSKGQTQAHVPVIALNNTLAVPALPSVHTHAHAYVVFGCMGA
eukprot:137821-Chlamydomonas_euryale.AAC.1